MAAAVAGDGVWTTTYPFGGIVNGLAIDPSNPQIVYAAPVWRGIYRSTDGGAAWTNVLDTQPNLPFDRTNIFHIAVHPTSGALHVLSTGAHARSSDGGATWTTLAGSATPLWTMAFDPGNPNVAYVATDGGVYKTTDNGSSWTLYANGLPAAESILSLAVNPAATNVVYAGARTSGIYKSTNGGASWSSSNNAATIATAGDIALDPADSQRVYVADATAGRLFRSDNGGASWTQLAEPFALFGQRAARLMAIDGSSAVYVATGGSVAVSTDLGANWTYRGVSSFQTNELVMDPSNNSTLLAGTGGDGVYRSSDTGTSWAPSSTGIRALGLQHSRAKGLIVHPAAASKVFAGGNNNIGGFRSLDGGQTWARMTFPNNGLSSFAAHPSDANLLYAFHNDLWKTTDDGATWTGINPVGACCFTEGDIALAPSNAQRLYFAGSRSGSNADGMWRSLDGGTSWTAITAGLTNTRIHVLAVDPTAYDTVFAAATPELQPAAIYKSTDAGNTWTQVGAGIPGQFFPNQFAIDPTNTNVIYLAGERQGGGIYKSIDGGATFTQVLSENANAVVLHPTSNNLLYAGTWNTNGFYRSTDFGQTWIRINAGLSARPGIEAIALHPSNPDRVFLGTTAGVFEISFAATGYVDVRHNADAGPGSLRDAIDQANSDGKKTIITWATSTTGQTIHLQSPLPPLSGGSTTIDGDLDGNCGPNIAISGAAAGQGSGLSIHSADNVIRDLAIHSFAHSGIAISGHFNRVECSHVGTGFNRSQPLGNLQSGISIHGGASDNVVERNTVAFNAQPGGPWGGVAVLDGGTFFTFDDVAFTGAVAGPAQNYPAIHFPGTRGAFRSVDGIEPRDPQNRPFGDQFGGRFTGSITVGQSGSYTFNLTQADDAARVRIDGTEVVSRNCCGSGAPSSAQVALSGTHSIAIDYFDGPGAASLQLEISGPGSVGFSSDLGPGGLRGEFFQLRVPSERNRISRNAIYANGQLGIELDAIENGFGVNPNDGPGDPDIGPNTALNFPVITSHVFGGGSSFTIQGTAPANSTVEIFASEGDPSGHGEGQVYLATVTASGGGTFSASVTLTPGFNRLTATATDALGNTSEFGPNWPLAELGASRWVETPIFSFVPDIFGPVGYVAGDLDNDGDLDLVALGRSNTPTGQACRLLVLLQNGGQYSGISQEPLGPNQGLCQAREGLALGDLDRDGDLDIVAQGLDNGSPIQNPKLIVLLNNGNGTFGGMIDISNPGLWNGSVALGDIDNDGDLDLAASGEDSTGTPRFLIFRNEGYAAFNLVQEPRGVNQGYTHGAGLVFGDVDSDGDLDIVASGGGAGRSLHIYRNTNGSFALAQTLIVDTEGLNNSSLRLADTDLDGDLDLVAAGNNFSGTERARIVHFVNQGGSFASAYVFVRELSPAGGWQGLAVGDVNGDGYPDIVANGNPTGPSFQPVVLYFANQNGSFPTAESLPATFTGPILLGDFDGEADLDMVGLPVRNLYQNVGGPANAPPSAPAGLAASATNVLTWGASADDHTPAAALSYELCVGTAAGQCDVISGVYGTPLTGTFPLMRVAPGQPGRRLQLVPGPYYWRVRALDTGLAAGPWSAEATFEANRLISINDVTVVEGDAGTSLATFTVSLSHPASQEVTVEFQTAPGSATAADFVGVSGTVTFQVGETSQPIDVLINGDTVPEPDKTFTIALSNANGAAISDSEGVGTILDNDIGLAINDAEVREGITGQASMNFLVTLSRTSSQTVTVHYSTADGTATVGPDYGFRSGVLTFTPGTRTQTITVNVNGDANQEPTETFTVHLFNPANAVLVDDLGIGTIVDDDATIPLATRAIWNLAQEGMSGLWSVASDGAQYVLVGDFGQIWTSPYGGAWTRRTNPDPAQGPLRGVTYAGGQFIAVGQVTSTILTSPDGVIWTLRSGPTGGPGATSGVTHGNGRYVTVGAGGRIQTSPDGVTWTIQVASVGGAPGLNGVAFGAGVFVAVGDSAIIRTSADGTTWSPATPPPGWVSRISNVAFANGQFVAVGGNGIATSPDGTTWTSRSTTSFPTFSGVAGDGGMVLVAAGGGSWQRSTDNGLTWAPFTVADGGPGVARNAFGVGFGAQGGFVLFGANGALYVSLDGATFTSFTLPASRFLQGLASGNGTLCAVGGSGAVVRSSDGVAWSNGTGLPAPFGPANYDRWRSVLWDGAQFVAVGSGSAVMTSPDCAAWTDRNPGRPSHSSLGGGVDYSDVTFGNGLYVAVGQAFPPGMALPFIATSPDTTTWTERPTGVTGPNSKQPLGVAYGNGLFVVVGRHLFGQPLLFTSSDGLAWTERVVPLFGTDHLSDVTFANGLFVAVGSRTYTSADGVTWSERFTGAGLTGVSFSNGRFIAVGPSGVIAQSLDGLSWTLNSSPTRHHLHAVAYLPSSDRFAAVGDSAIVYSNGYEAPTVGISDVTVTEGTGGTATAIFTVTLSSTSASQVTVDVTTSDRAAVAPADYTHTSGTVTFPPNTTTPQTFSVPIATDTEGEPTETFTALLSNATNASISDGLAIATIVDDDQPALSLQDRLTTEGHSGTAEVVFTIFLSKPATAPVVVTYSTASDSATENDDYQGVSGTLTIPAGVQSRAFAVFVHGDTAVEGPETFFFNVTGATNATILDGQAVGTIVDDEGVPAITWTKAQGGMPAMRAGVFDGTQYVIVGDYGNIWTSPDVTSWTDRTPPASFRALRGLASGPFGLVAVGGETNRPAVLRSTDGGATWVPIDLPGVTTALSLSAVTFGNGLYVAVGPSGQIVTSPDAVTWTAQASGVSSTLTGVAYGGGAYVAVGSDRTILHSTDAMTWLPQTAPSTVALNLNAVAHTGSQFVVVGGSGTVITSPDGLAWTKRFSGVNANLLNVTTSGGLLAAVGGGTILTSPDGVVWTSQPANPNPTGHGVGRNLQAVMFGGSGFLAVGSAGQLYHSPAGTGPWNSITLSQSRQFNAVAVGNGTYCAVGNFGAVARSFDGMFWTNHGGPFDAMNINWVSVAFGNGAFVAVGAGAEIIRSTDCVSWTETNAGRLGANTAQPFSGFLNDVTFGNGRFVAVGDDAPSTGLNAPLLLVSSDAGQTWQPVSAGLPATPDRSLDQVAFGGDRFVALGGRFAFEFDVVTSTDGLTWSPVATTAFDGFGVADLQYGNGLFVAVGNGVWTSADGLAWTRVSDARNNNEIVFGDGLFMGAGNSGTAHASFDGATWTQSSTPTNNSLFGISYLAIQDRFVAVGDSTILYSNGVAPLTVSINDVTVTEGHGGTTNATFTISLSRLHPVPVTVTAATANGSATAGSDYTAVNEIVTVPVGATTAVFTVPVTGDLTLEDHEFFSVTLSNPSAGTIADGTGTGTITDDEPIGLAISDEEIREGIAGQTSINFLVTLTRTSAQTITVNYSTADGTATVGPDYGFRSGVLTFGPGTRTQTITVNVNGDANQEPNETFTVHLFNPANAVLVDDLGVGTIVDDDATIPPPTRAIWNLAQEGMSNVWSVATDGAQYVLVGDFGQIWTSPYGGGWTRRTNPDTTQGTLRGVTYGGGQFVAVGTVTSTILTSPDGVIWTLRSGPTGGPGATTGVTHGNGRYVTVGAGGRIQTSPDGVTWTIQVASIGGAPGLTGVAFGAGVFVAVGDSGIIRTSADGTTWSPATPPPGWSSRISNVAFANGQFVAVGGNGIATSSDGTTWTSRSTTSFPTFSGVAGDGGMVLVAAGGGSWLRSADNGLTWAPFTVADGGPGVVRNAFNVGYGPGGFVLFGANGGLYVSLDGATFTSFTLPASRFLQGLASGNGTLCAVGSSGAVVSSPDGVAWSNETGLAAPFGAGSYDSWRSVLWDGAQFVAVGNGSAVMTSPDCAAWTDRNPGRPSHASSGGFVDYNDVAVGNGLYVAVGRAFPPGMALPFIATSPDTTTWTERPTGVTGPNSIRPLGVAYGNGLFVVVGRHDFGPPQAVLFTSSDGLAWTGQSVAAFGSDTLSDVTFANGLFVAVGSRTYTSADGVTWSLRFSGAALNGVSFSNGRFIGVGPSGAIAQSLDGVSWTLNSSPTRHHLHAVGYTPSSDRFAAVGDSAIVYSNGYEAPTVGVSSVTVAEGDGPGVNAVFNIVLASTTPQQVTVNFTMTDGSATAGADYTASSGTVIFPPNSTASQQIVVPITGDAVGEPTEQFFVTLSGATNATLDPVVTTAAGVIEDNDTPAIIAGDRAIGEGNTGTIDATFIIQLTRTSTLPVSVSYSTANGSSESNDYTAVSGTLTIPPFAISGTIVVPIVGDTRNEPNETFFLNLSAPVNAVIQDGQGLGTIVDDERLPAAQWTRAQEGMASLRAGAFDGTTYVVGGDYGDIWTSTDTINWTNRSVPVPVPGLRVIRGLVFGGGQFVAVGLRTNGPDVLTSPDGAVWTVRNAAGVLPNYALNGVAYGNNLYVAVGQGGSIVTSPDGVTWTLRASGTSSNLLSVAFGGGAFVAVGFERTVLRSTDGITWTAQTAPPDVAQALNGITHTGTEFVVVGGAGTAMTSPDGVVWTRRFTGFNGNLSGVTSGGGLIAAVGGGVVFTSADGSVWTSRTLAPPAGNGIARNLLAVVFGAQGFVGVGGSGGLYTSSNGIGTWTSQTLVASRNLRSVAVGPAGYCAVGPNGAIASSPEGLTWTNQTGIAPASNNNWTSVIFANSLFVAVGGSSEIITSPDCVTWTEQHAGRLNNTPTTSSVLADVTFGNNRFVAVGANDTNVGMSSALVMTSTDGLAWTATPTGLSSTANHSLEAVAFGAGRFVAMGRRDDLGVDVITSLDGLSWTPVATSMFTREAVIDIVFANGAFVAAGTRIWTSPDGLTWAKTADVRPINGLAFGNDLFVATGGNGAIYSSFDAVSWLQNPAQTGHTLLGAAYSATLDRFVAVGDSTIQFSSGVGPPEISIDDVSMQEVDTGQQDFVFTVNLTRGTTQTVSVNYATANGTALAGSDYVAKSGTLTFLPGETTATFFVRVNGDFDEEPDETFVVNLSGSTNATIADAQGVGTIVNDDVSPAVSVSDVTMQEGDTGQRDFIFTLTLSSPAEQRITVAYATANGTALSGIDYVAKSDTAVFTAGESTAQVIVKVNGDFDQEPNEAFFFNLSNPAGLSIADSQGIGTVLNDDVTPVVSISDASVVEGNSGQRDLVFNLTLSAPARQRITVQYATANGTALAGSDYVAKSGLAVFNTGQGSVPVTVRVIGDFNIEASETVLVNLSAPTGMTLGDGQGIGTIVNDDTAPVVTISDCTVLEGNTGKRNCVFFLTLSSPAPAGASLSYTTGNGSAIANSDFDFASGTVVFTPGQITAQIIVRVRGDRILEGDEVYFVNLFGPSNVVIGDAQGMGTIRNDDIP